MKIFKVVCAVILTAFVSVSQATMLELIVENGQLMGADNVTVDGSLYDVRFLDGTCIDLFDGCDESSDFTFNTEDDARLASQALLDTVFVDGVLGNFDADIGLTNGCYDVGFGCGVVTAFGVNVNGFEIDAITASNRISELDDKIVLMVAEIRVSEDLKGPADFVYASWQEASTVSVPAPSVNIVLLMGIAGLIFVQRRKLA